jgi:hypothetical protein
VGGRGIVEGHAVMNKMFTIKRTIVEWYEIEAASQMEAFEKLGEGPEPVSRDIQAEQIVKIARVEEQNEEF